MNNQEITLIQDLGTLYPKETSKKKFRYGLYRCFCGNEFKSQTRAINAKHTKSCGCSTKRLISETSSTHGLSKHPIYIVRQSMIQRCNNPKALEFFRYGARGITICDEWLNDFMSFYSWALESGYKKGLSIDRINSDGNYEPSNCRWSTPTIQSRNTRKIHSNNKSGFRGVIFAKDKNKWRAAITINSKSKFIGYFYTPLEAAKAYDQYIIDNNLEHTRNF